MKEFERLTVTKKINEYCSTVECGEHCEDCYVGKLYERLAELEDKLENGTLIELPCKVGDTVYCIYRDDDYEYWIEEALVHDFIYTNYGEIDIGTECRMLGKVYRYCVCLTKAEAEKKLKELKGE